MAERTELRRPVSKIFAMRVLRYFFLSCFLLPLMLPAAAPPQTTLAAPSGPSGAGPGPDEQKILDLVNREREKANVPRLVWDQNLAEAARAHSALMADYANVGHVLPGESAVAERMAASHARFTASGENVALADSAEEVHLALMNSPGHRRNIMSPRYSAVGIGVVLRKGRLYVTQDFAWLIPAFSESQFYDAMVEAINEARRAHGMRVLMAHDSPHLHDAACATKGDVAGVSPGVSGNAKLVLFTLSDPGKAAETLKDYLATPQLLHMHVGVCFRPDQQYGPANFWVAIVFQQ
jgi:cysteine-rich secretory family protein